MVFFAMTWMSTAVPGIASIMSTSQIVMLALAVAGLTVILLSTRRKIVDRQREPRATARDRYASLEQETATRRNVEDVMLELDQLSRQIHGRIDTRLAKLEAIIRDADERIDRLSRLVRVADRDAACDVTLDAESPSGTSGDRTPTAANPPKGPGQPTQFGPGGIGGAQAQGSATSPQGQGR